MHLQRSAFGIPEALRCFLGSALLVLAACDRVTRPDLTIINGKEPESLDPAIVVGQADGRVTMAIFEGLTRYNYKTADPEPGLAEKWDISADALSYTFHIRTNAAWSTGEPITADDFVFSWLRVLNPVSAADYAGNLYYIKNGEAYNTGKLKDPGQVGVRALNARTLVVELEHPTAFFLDLCAFPTQCVVPRQAIEAHGDAWLKARPLPCSGAYELVSWKLNDRIQVRKNRYYWDAQNTASERIDLLSNATASSALNLFLSGGVDVVWDKDLVPSDLLDVLRKRRDFHTFDYMATYFYRYNVTRKPFNDPRVRQALAMAIDKKRIVEKITRGGEKPADSIVPPGIPGYSSPEGLKYDPRAARKLLAEAGYEGGKGFPRFTYLINSGREHESIGVEILEMWRRELGIQAEMKALEWLVYLRAQVELDYDIVRSSWIGDYFDPNTFLDLFMSSNPNNRTGWKSAAYDNLLRQANSLADQRVRSQTLRQAEALLVRDQAPIVPLYIYEGFNFFDPDKIDGIANNLRDEHPLRTIRKRK